MPFDNFWRDIHFSLRVLRRSAGFTTVAVVTTALGVGGSTALFSVVRGALLERWPYDGYDRIVSFRANSARLARTRFPLWSAVEYRDLAARTDIFDEVIAGEGRGVTIGLDRSVERVPAGLMTANAWTMLGVRPLLGRTFDRSDDRPGAPSVAVLSFRFWQNRLGGRPDVVGAGLRIDERQYTVVGVMPRTFVWWDEDLWLPLQLDPRDRDRADRRWYVQARLRPGVSLEQAQAALQSTSSRWQHEFGLPEYDNLKIELVSLVAETLRDLRYMLYVLLAAVALVLTVASANVATLLLIRGVRRRGEIAVRLALGASRSRVARQLLIENVLVALLAGILGLWIGSLLLQPVVSLIPYGIPAEAHIATDWRSAAFALGVAVLFGALFGIVPAARASNASLTDDLKDQSRRTAGAPRILESFMAGQFALALVVLSATIFVVWSFDRTLAANPGYDDANRLTFHLAFAAQDDPARHAGAVRRILDRLAHLPGVTAAAATTSLPIGEGPRALFAPGDDDILFDANVDEITPGYFGALNTPLVDGRDFQPSDDDAHRRVAIVSAAAAARLWPHGRAVGRRLVWRPRGTTRIELTVVGVAGDMRRQGIAAAAPAVFLPYAQEPDVRLIVLIHTPSDQDAIFAAARSAIAAEAPDVPVCSPRTLASLRADALGSERLAAVLLSAFGAVALLLSTIGIYGATRYTVEQRTGELGIRLALGARPRELFGLVLGRGVRSLAIGTTVGAIGSWIVLRVLAAAVVGVQGAWPVVVIVAAAPLILSSLIAAYLPARLVGAISPVEALRADR